MPPHTHIQIIQHPANPAIRPGRTPKGHIVVRPVLVCGVDLDGEIVNKLVNVKTANQPIKEICLIWILRSQPVERFLYRIVIAMDGSKKAIDHFKKARAIEPGYQKVHHNLAMLYYMINDPNLALASINDSLRLDANNKSSMLLKSVVLEKLGRTAEAKAIRERAEFLPGGNWSERSELR